MKRYLSITCLCLLSPLAIVACGDDSGGGNGSQDGGVSTKDIDQLDNEFTDKLDKEVTDLENQLKTGLDGVQGDLDQQKKDAADAAAAAKARFDALEEIGSCSAGEFCTPDGLSIVQSGIADIIGALCEYETGCCTAEELNLSYGNAFRTAKECVAAVTSQINHGSSPNIGGASYIAQQAVANAGSIVSAMNDGKILIALNAKGVTACTKALKALECNTLPDVVAGPTRCVAGTDSSEDDECALANLLDGLQPEGAACGNSGIPGLDECATGLVCQIKSGYRDGPGSNPGICAVPPAEGDPCFEDSDCFDQGTLLDNGDSTLFCNAGTCQALGGAGDPCAYIEPTFANNGNGNLNPRGSQQRSTSVDCMPGFSCDPVNNKCVADCSDGAICQVNSADFDCPEGTVCNITETPALRISWNLGACRVATAIDDGCFQDSECESDHCINNGAWAAFPDPVFVCGAARAADGAVCPTSTAKGPQPYCESRECDAAGECAAECTTTADCAANYYCDNSPGPNAPKYCQPEIADGTACQNDYTGQQNPTCSSGYCYYTGICAAKVPNGAVDPTNVCDSGDSAQCANGWCDTSVSPYFCTAFFATSVACIDDEQCGSNGYCASATSLCVASVADGGACNNSADGTRACKSGLTCVENGTSDTCQYGGEFPAGAQCNVYAYNAEGSQLYGQPNCTSGWCPQGTCLDLIADGDDCAADAPTKNRCVDGHFCDYEVLDPADPDYHTGTCAAQHLAGETCSQRFNSDSSPGTDCLNNVTCQFVYDQFVCGSGARPADTLMCMGT